MWSDGISCTVDAFTPSEDTTVCHSTSMLLKRAASVHSITADSASLCSLHYSRAAGRRHRNTQPSLLQPRNVTARLEGQTEPRLAPAPVASWCLQTRRALPGRGKAVAGDVSYQLGATGRLASVYCALSQSLFLSLIEWLQPQALSASSSSSPCLITAQQFGLSRPHLRYPWNVRPSSAAATHRRS